jgi:hypothetical protein
VFVIALVALTRVGIMRSVVTSVSRQGAGDIDAFLKAALLVAADVAFVIAGIDQFALGHGGALSSLLFQ